MLYFIVIVLMTKMHYWQNRECLLAILVSLFKMTVGSHAKNQHPGKSPEFSRVLLKGQGKISFSPKLPRSDGQSSVSDVSTKTDDFATSCSENIISNAPAEHHQDTTEDCTAKVKLCDSTLKSAPDNHHL